MAEADGHEPDITVWVHSQTSVCDTGTGFSYKYMSLLCHYHSTIASYLFIYLPPTLYNVFLPVLQFSPVSIIPPLLHSRLVYTLLLPEIQKSETWKLPKTVIFRLSGNFGLDITYSCLVFEGLNP